MKITIGQRIVAALIAHQLGISTDRAFKLYVQGRDLDPSWEEVGATLLASERASINVLGGLRSPLGPQLVRSDSDSRPTASSPSRKPTVEKINPRTERESDVL